MQHVVHITPDSSHSLHLAKMLAEVARESRSHVDHLIVLPGATHGKSVLAEIQTAFPNTQVLLGNITLPNELSVCIFHGMFNPVNFKLIDYFKAKNAKLIWSTWGGDLYRLNPHALPDWTKKLFGVIIAELDSDLLRNYEGLVFSSPNFYMPKLHVCDKKRGKTSDCDLKMIVGNSGDPSNRHKDVLNVLMKSQIKLSITIPFAYNGSAGYKSSIIDEIDVNNSLHNIQFIDHLMPIDEYADLFLNSDLAIYHHSRQQGFGSMRLAAKAGCAIALDFEVKSAEDANRINPCLSSLVKMGANNFFDTQLLLDNFSDDLLKQIATRVPAEKIKSNSDEALQIIDYLRLLAVTNGYEKR